MADPQSDKALWSILDAEPADAETGTEKNVSDGIPNLDQRVTFFLEALHGPDYQASMAERSAVKERLLSEFALSLRQTPSEAEAEWTAAERPQAMPTSPENFLQRIASLRTLIRMRVGNAVSIPTSWSFAFGRGPGFAFASVALVIAFGTAWSGTWFYAAHEMDLRVTAWLDSEKQSGRTYECGSRTLSGFPTRTELRCTAPSMTIAANGLHLAVKAQEIIAVASLLSPGAISAEIIGPAIASQDGHKTVLKADFSNAHAELNETGSDGLGLAIADLVVNRSGSTGPLAKVAKLAVQTRPVPDDEAPGTEIDIKIDDGLVAANKWPSAIAVTAFLAADPQSGVAAASPRQLDIVRARVQTGAMVAIANGGVSIDAAGEIAALLKVTSTTDGMQRLASVLGAADQQIGTQIALLAQTQSEEGDQNSSDNAGAESTDPASDNHPTIDLPLSVKSGEIFLGSMLISTATSPFDDEAPATGAKP